MSGSKRSTRSGHRAPPATYRTLDSGTSRAKPRKPPRTQTSARQPRRSPPTSTSASPTTPGGTSSKPSAKASLPARRSRPGWVNVFTTLRASRLPRRLSVLCSIMLNAGLRVSEAVSLRWEDVYLDPPTLHVQRAAWNRPGTKGPRDAAGSSRRHRLVHVSTQLVRELLSLSPRHPHGWLFPGRGERHLTTRTAQRKLARATRGLVKPHDLRHAYASHLWALGADFGHIQLSLGHAKLTTTAVYIHVPQTWYDVAHLPASGPKTLPLPRRPFASAKPQCGAAAAQPSTSCSPSTPAESSSSERRLTR